MGPIELNHTTLPAILVSGTGRVPLPRHQKWVVSRLGAAICRAGFNLITGGWEGVDADVAQAFRESGGEPSRIVQLVQASDRSPRTHGEVIEVADDLEEWVEAINRAQAVVLVGGLGGTYGTYDHARRRHVPVVPIPGTGGDAERAFHDILKRWSDESPFRRVSRAEFAHLDVPIDLQSDAERAVALALAVLKSELTPPDVVAQTTASTVVNINQATIGGLAVGPGAKTHGVVSNVASTHAQGADTRPIVAISYRSDRGWIVRNLGNAPVVHAIVCQSPGTHILPEPRWERPVRIAPLAVGEERALSWLGHTNVDRIGVLYQDVDGVRYSTACQHDENVHGDGDRFPAWKEDQIEREWTIGARRS